MVECPKCSGLNPAGAQVCGNCGASLESVNNNFNNTNNNANNNDGIVLYEKEFFNNTQDTSKIKNNHATFRFGDILLLVLSIASWVFVPIRLIKLGLAFLFFYMAETSNNKNSVLLVLTRVITAIQIWGIVIALILKISTSPDIVAKYFEYFRF